MRDQGKPLPGRGKPDHRVNPFRGRVGIFLEWAHFPPERATFFSGNGANPVRGSLDHLPALGAGAAVVGWNGCGDVITLSWVE